MIQNVPNPKNLPEASDSVPSAALQPRCIIFLVSHPSAGGVQEIWADLAAGFRQRGYHVMLVALYPGDNAHQETAAYTPWVYVAEQRPKSMLAFGRLFRSLLHVVRTSGAQRIYAAMPFADVLAPLAALLVGRGVRVVTSHHSPASTHNLFLTWADTFTGSLASVDAIVCVSHAVNLSLDTKPAPYKVKRKVIANALPPRVEHYIETLVRPRLRAENRLIVAIGRLAPQKNYPVLIRAAARMPNVELNILGIGPEEAVLRQLAADLNVTDRVHFLGLKRREEALSILNEGAVFAQPSLFEGHSLALIEAATLGLPLVVSRVPVQIEGVTCKDGSTCGILIAPDDDVELAAQLLRLLDEPGFYRDYAERARRLANDISYNGMVSAYEDLMLVN